MIFSCTWSCLLNVLSVTPIKTKSQAISCLKATNVLGPTVAHQSEVSVLKFSDSFAINFPPSSKLQGPKLFFGGYLELYVSAGLPPTIYLNNVNIHFVHDSMSPQQSKESGRGSVMRKLKSLTDRNNGWREMNFGAPQGT